MKQKMQKMFIQDTHQEEVYLKYFNFKQGNLFMADYTCEFEFLMLKCDIKEPKPQSIAYYTGGLKDSIVDVIRLQLCWTFNDVYKLANNVEKQQLKESKKLTFFSFRRANYSN